MNLYETNFVLTSVLSEDQARDVARKFRTAIEGWGGRVTYQQFWQRDGYQILFEFECDGRLIADLELAFRRDERVVRFRTVRLAG